MVNKRTDALTVFVDSVEADVAFSTLISFRLAMTFIFISIWTEVDVEIRAFLFCFWDL